MASKSWMTYQEPDEKFEKISGRVIIKYDLEVVGLYCKMVMLSRGKTLSMDFLSKKIAVSIKKLRRIIVFLEGEGYITRDAVKSNDGKFSGWHYKLWSEPVSDKKRTHAGKSDLTENGLYQKWTSPQTDKSENGKENIISTKDRIYNNTDNSTINSPVNVNLDNTSGEVKKAPSKTPEEQIYEKKMTEMFPHIMKMEQPLTLEQAKKLKERFKDDDLIRNIMYEMENWRDLNKKCRSAYLTIINWCQRRLEKQ